MEIPPGTNITYSFLSLALLISALFTQVLFKKIYVIINFVYKAQKDHKTFIGLATQSMGSLDQQVNYYTVDFLTTCVYTYQVAEIFYFETQVFKLVGLLYYLLFIA